MVPNGSVNVMLSLIAEAGTQDRRGLGLQNAAIAGLKGHCGWELIERAMDGR